MAALSRFLEFSAAFRRARRERRGGSRQALLARQERRLGHFLHRVLPGAAFYRPYAGRPLDALPVVDKAVHLESFAAMNRFGIPLEEALAVALEAERSRDFAPRLHGLTVGLSSGTSGRRGVFLVADGERAAWAGLVLGRLLAPSCLRQILSPWRPRLRVAFFLRSGSNLYQTLDSRRLELRFYDLKRPFAELAAELAGHGADILVAPATVLAALAAAGLELAPRQVLAVAEVLEDDHRRRVEKAFGVRVDQVYQATEGFLGSSCELGRIHLHEEEILFEKEWLDAERTRFHPILTDLRRETQLIVRYRLDDVLRLAPEQPCPCGRPTLALEAIEGRADDVFAVAGAGGGTITLFPDLLRQMMAVAGQGIEDYVIEQHPGGVRLGLRLEPGAEGEAARARVAAAWASLLEGCGAAPVPLEWVPYLAAPLDRKKRRIRRVA